MSYALFGEHGLFDSRWDDTRAPFGMKEAEIDKSLSDHEVVTRRLQWLLNNSEMAC